MLPLFFLGFHLCIGEMKNKCILQNNYILSFLLFLSMVKLIFLRIPASSAHLWKKSWCLKQSFPPLRATRKPTKMDTPFYVNFLSLTFVHRRERYKCTIQINSVIYIVTESTQRY